MEIACPTCVLRPLVAGDAASLATHANDREIWLNLRDGFPHPYGLADAEAYIALVSKRTPHTSFGIEVDGEVAGGISLRRGDDIARYTSEIGYWLGRRYWGRGIVTDALRAATRYALTDLGMHRIFALPFVRNDASRRVLEKSGYVMEGRLKNSAVKAGEVLDQWMYAAYADSVRLSA